MGRIFQFRRGQAVGVVALVAAVFAVSGEDGKAGTLVLGIRVGVDVAKVHLCRRRRQREDARIGAGRAGDVARRLRSEALADVGGCRRTGQGDESRRRDGEFLEYHGTPLAVVVWRGTRVQALPRLAP
ncbi:hypothetical protein GGD81_004730 [Rhodobium orientis]|nr:hypothetical protein [Rhodobium orientis]